MNAQEVVMWAALAVFVLTWVQMWVANYAKTKVRTWVADQQAENDRVSRIIREAISLASIGMFDEANSMIRAWNDEQIAKTHAAEAAHV